MKAKRGNKQTGNGIMRILVALLAIGFFGYVAMFGFGADGSGGAQNIKLGLDLDGGVSITYQVIGETPSAEAMADTIYKLRLRAETYSQEAEVYQEGSNRINVDIPGVSDANKILEELGNPGSLEFRDPAGEVVLTGNDIAGAQAGMYKDQQKGSTEYVVDLTMTDEGAKKFADATSANIGKRIAIIYDGNVISEPQVLSAITGGTAQITRIQSWEEADQLASTIRIGAIPLELEEVHSKVVGAKLGEDAIATSLKAGAIGFVLVAVFMIVVYAVPGIAATLALMLYVGLVIFLLSTYKITLTISGIAGIILSIGMAVDANVIIFTRIREEMKAGKTVRSAMKDGFSKAMSAIIDGNVTTLIAAAVLWWKSTGMVKGFAQTLALGIVVSMFTALFVTKFILTGFVNLGLDSEKAFGYNRAKDKKEFKPINFLGKKTVFFIISGVMIIAGFVAMGVNSAGKQGAILNYSLEFRGGTATTITFNEDMSLADIGSEVVPVVSTVTGDNDIQTQKIDGTTEVIVKTRTLTVEERENLSAALQEAFGVDKEKVTAETISAVVSDEMKSDAIVAVLIATIAMLLYIWFRFKDVRFASSAVIALLHDVLVVLTFYAVTRWTVGSTFIACMLTIVGYSINATIVIFDRIREGLRTMRDKDSLEVLVNTSITQTLTRSIYTSLTTFIMVFVLYILGVSAIKEFAMPLMVGIAVGAYSSVCITGALWYVMKTKFVKKAE